MMRDEAEAFLRSLVRPDAPLTAKQVSVLLGVHPNTVKRIAPTSLPYFTIGERRDRRYLAGDVRLYIGMRSMR